MNFPVIPFSHEYYIINLPSDQTKISKENREALFRILQYDKCINFRGEQIKFAPVIRLYGLHHGIQSCVHVHGFFPYFYIKVQEMSHLFENTQFVNSFIENIHQAYVGTFFHGYDNSTKNQFQLIFKWELVMKRDFYGVHLKDELFLKLYLYDWQYIKQVVQLLQSGAILEYVFQSYESHLSYFMHFYADVGIFGMTLLNIGEVVLRRRFPGAVEAFLDSTGRGGLVLDRLSKNCKSSKLSKLSICAIEVDCHWSSIFNEQFIQDLSFQNVVQTLNKQSEQSGVNCKKLVEEFNVETTLTLNRLWQDEARRRQKWNKVGLQLLIDKRNNREGNQEIFQTDKFAGVNNIGCSRLEQHIMEYIEQGKNQIEIKHFGLQQSQLNMEKVRWFFAGQKGEMELCRKSAIDRFKEYVQRKRDLFELIKNQGSLDYEYRLGQQNYDEDDESGALEMVDDQEDQEDIQNIIQTSQDQIMDKNIFEVMKKNQQSKDQNKFRKKYKVNKLKRTGPSFQVFTICQFCSKVHFECICMMTRQNIIDPIVPIQNFKISKLDRCYLYQIQFPGVKAVIDSLIYNSSTVIPQYAYFSSPQDLYKHYDINYRRIVRTSTYLQYLDRQAQKQKGQKFYVPSISNQDRLPHDFRLPESALKRIPNLPSKVRPRAYLYQVCAPAIDEVLRQMARQGNYGQVFQFEQISQFSQSQQREKKAEQITEEQLSIDLTLMNVEIFSKCTETRLADPMRDEVSLISICVYGYWEQKIRSKCLLIVDSNKYESYVKNNCVAQLNGSEIDGTDIFYVQRERDLLRLFILLVILFDPDLMGGWDLEQWGLSYLVQRGNQNSIDILTEIGRSQGSMDDILECLKFDEFLYLTCQQSILYHRLQLYMNVRIQWNEIFIQKRGLGSLQPTTKQKRKGGNYNKEKYSKRRNNLYIVGRVLVNIWRHAQTDLKLNDYSLENVTQHQLSIQIPTFTNHKLTQWFQSDSINLFIKALLYFQRRCELGIDILVSIDTIPKTTEISRLYGCEFESVGQRGSQFKIESVLCRVTKQNGYLLLSATRLQVSQQKILESIPLVIEPPKHFLVDPVIVLDFQSLYPSIMIAYNLCFTTCLGNINEPFFKQKKRFGVIQANIDFESILKINGIQQLIQSGVLVTPNNVAFLTRDIQEGIIPRILSEFLQTRIMIKRSSKLYKDSEQIQKLCQFRQLALKLFMNIMYGYCGASFSGRMPSGDIADSVVEIGRTLLNQCIKRINSQREWHAEVIYGDTDSLFVLLRGSSQASAFKIGEEIARVITADYPHPIELKFEKVYNPLVLLAKKRYVGYKCERLDGFREFEAKGIELVRRDGCDATVKVMRKALQILFDTKDLSQVKQYMFKYWSKILNGHSSINDYVIAKEVKLGKYAATLPAHAVAATKAMEKDPMRAPKYGERIKYVVLQSDSDKAQVKDLVATLDEYLSNPNYRINSLYYIKKHINAAIGRILSTVDVQIDDWFSELPKGLAKRGFHAQSAVLQNSFTLHKFYRNNVCILCSNDSNQEICNFCLMNNTVALILIKQKQKKLEQDVIQVRDICRKCSELQGTQLELEDVPCIEYNCPILQTRQDTLREQREFSKISQKYFDCLEIYEEI